MILWTRSRRWSALNFPDGWQLFTPALPGARFILMPRITQLTKMLLLSSARAQWGQGCSQTPMRDFSLQAVTYSHRRKLDQLLFWSHFSLCKTHKSMITIWLFLNHFFFFKKAHEHRTVQHVTEESCMVPLDKWQWVTQRWQYIHASARAQHPPVLVFLIINTNLPAGEKGEQERTTQRTKTRSFWEHRWDCTVREHQVQEQHINLLASP